MLADLSPETVVIKAVAVEIPLTEADITEIDFKARKIESSDWALAALAVLAGRGQTLTKEMLTEALKLRFKPEVFELALAVVEKATDWQAKP
jgi:hypothetical protein